MHERDARLLRHKLPLMSYQCAREQNNSMDFHLHLLEMLRACLFGLLGAFHWKKQVERNKRGGFAVGFSKASLRTTHARRSTSWGALRGFPQLCPLKSNRHNALALFFSLFTGYCHRVSFQRLDRVWPFAPYPLMASVLRAGPESVSPLPRPRAGRGKPATELLPTRVARPQNFWSARPRLYIRHIASTRINWSEGVS
jgi:hypothetical protein